ncbi:MAG: hypothetical protein H6Q26_3427 [Bacteroidetes bacterium]|nr:hypothetical protein [Bacteroidota bacterium]
MFVRVQVACGVNTTTESDKSGRLIGICRNCRDQHSDSCDMTQKANTAMQKRYIDKLSTLVANIK